MKEHCPKCNSGYLQPTTNPKMLRCDFCGRTECELTMKEYLETLRTRNSVSEVISTDY